VKNIPIKALVLSSKKTLKEKHRTLKNASFCGGVL
jgi:hypothetical protein